MSSILTQLGSAVKGKLDTKLNLSGGTLTGDLSLADNPTADAHASNKAYVDLFVGGNLSSGSYDPSAKLATDVEANYHASATDLDVAIGMVDAALKDEADNIDNLQSTTGQSTANFSITGTYFGSATSLTGALQSLDTQVNTNATSISTNANNISTNAGNISTNATNISNNTSAISTNANDIDTLQAKTSNQSESGSGETLTTAFSKSVSVGSNLTISGNLTVNGTTATVDTTNVTVADSLMVLSKGAGDIASASNDAGFVVERGSTENNAAMFWDEGDDKFKVVTTSIDGSASSDISGAENTALASFDADLYQNGVEVGSVDDFTTALGGSSSSGSGS